jgi:L-fucose/D-arabinose isomerase
LTINFICRIFYYIYFNLYVKGFAYMNTDNSTYNFSDLQSAKRQFQVSPRRLVGHIPTIAVTPVADGRTGAYESNVAGTWRMVEKVVNLIQKNVKLFDGTPPRVVVPPEIVYGARTGALAQEFYAGKGVSSNIWVSRSWAYSDELMSVCQGIGSSEWQQAAYGLNQTDRPGAVWLKAFCAAMDEKKRPIFAIYNPDLEDESADLAPYVSERILRFARTAIAIAEMRGKNYLSLGGVSMGIIGSDVIRNLLLHYFGMGSVFVDMVTIKGRMEQGFYNHQELQKAVEFMKQNFKFAFGKGKRPYTDEELLENCLKMTLITRDLMTGNAELASEQAGKAQGFKPDVEFAQGANAIIAGTQGQRAWTDLYPNFDLTESMLNSSFDWNGYRAPYLIATENDSKNALGMLAASLITGLPQLFADIRTNWTDKSVKQLTGTSISDEAPQGFIDKRNSGAAALDYAVDLISLINNKDIGIHQVADYIRNNPQIQEKLIKQVTANTVYTGANLEYFLGDGLSSKFRTPGGIPMTSYRYNVLDGKPTCSVVEGNTIHLPEKTAEHINSVTDSTWPETYWAPRDMTSFEYMSKIGPNHDGNSFGLIGADLVTFNSMLRIPIDLHNIPSDQIFRPTMWDRFGGDDFRACSFLGPVYK